MRGDLDGYMAQRRRDQERSAAICRPSGIIKEWRANIWRANGGIPSGTSPVRPYHKTVTKLHSSYGHHGVMLPSLESVIPPP